MKKTKIISVLLAVVLLFCMASPVTGVLAAEEEHVHHYVWVNGYNVTCTSDGYQLYVCEGCGQLEQRDIVPSTGHVDDNDDGLCDKCEEKLPNYFLKHLVALFLKFLRMVLKIG